MKKRKAEDGTNGESADGRKRASSVVKMVTSVIMSDELFEWTVELD